MYELNKKKGEWVELTTNIPNIFFAFFLKGVPLPKIFLTLEYYVYIHIDTYTYRIYICILFCFVFFPPHPCWIFRSTPHTFNLFAYIYCFYCTRHDTFYYAKNRYYILTSKIHIFYQEEEEEGKKGNNNNNSESIPNLEVLFNIFSASFRVEL